MGRPVVSGVRIRESPYYRKKIDENFVGTLETVKGLNPGVISKG